MGCLKLHTEENYTTLKVVYSVVSTRVLGEQVEKNESVFLEVGYRNAQSNGGDADAFGQMMNTGAVVWGGAEMGGQYLRQNNAAQAIGRSLGFGTQQTANALRGTLGVVSKVGKSLGVAGYGLQVASTGYKLYDGQSVGTAEAVGLGTSTLLLGAAYFAVGTVAAPFVAGAALIYGVGQLGSYMITGNTLEENYWGK